MVTSWRSATGRMRLVQLDGELVDAGLGRGDVLVEDSAAPPTTPAKCGSASSAAEVLPRGAEHRLQLAAAAAQRAEVPAAGGVLEVGGGLGPRVGQRRAHHAGHRRGDARRGAVAAVRGSATTIDAVHTETRTAAKPPATTSKHEAVPCLALGPPAAAAARRREMDITRHHLQLVFGTGPERSSTGPALPEKTARARSEFTSRSARGGLGGAAQHPPAQWTTRSEAV